MILYIILLVVILKLATDLLDVREGLDAEPPDLQSKCSFDVNVKFPKYDPIRNVYTNDNDFLYNNFQNILLYAKAKC